MAPDPLLERLQRALWPDYRLERELARGGMGIVYVAHDVTLNHDVAVKIIRPELATADAAEAFLREARILASVSHPNIVAIRRAGEGEGLHYYVMELVGGGGTTLAQRLESGRLSLEHAVQVGKDLLAGLEAVHHAGVVHRDIKPSNLFLLPTGALLADFGIASPPTRASPDARRRTRTTQGTPGYMAPEQTSGDPVTPLTDLYSAGAVLYEAITGRRYPPAGEVPSWKGMPRAIARVLRRALRTAPQDRWPGARAFRDALSRAYAGRYLRRTALFTAGGVLLGVTIAWLALRPASCSGALTVVVPRFDYVGPNEHRMIADSLARLTRAELDGHPDFCITAARRGLPGRAGGLLVRGRVVVADSTVRVELADLPARDVSAPLAAWPTLRDSLSYRILLAVWDAKSPLASSLPVRALPRTALGLARFLEGEQFVAAAQWENAYRAYTIAEATDSTCWLCSWRLSEVERWLGRERNPARAQRYLAHIDSFPPAYASLIRAAQLPLPARLDTLQAVTERSREFFLGWFQLGDELFHRGPLAGHPRAEAIPALETAARRRPDFGPAWEHLAWVYIAEGDSAAATGALDSLRRTGGAQDQYSASLRALLTLGFAWRFLPEDEALAMTRAALADPVAGASADLGAAPRMLGSFDAPQGEVGLGRILAAHASRDLQRSGLIAEVLGSVALGMPRRGLEVARELTTISPNLDIGLFAAELEAAIAGLDPPPDQHVATVAAARLQRWRENPAAPARLRDRAAWMTAWLDQPGVLPHATELDSVARNADPFYRTIARLTNAEQLARRGDVDGARRELLWHEHNDVVGLPTGLPQAAEVDWAFGTLARWRLARLTDGGDDRAIPCNAYRDVARLWAAGEPLYRARADSAGLHLRQLGCR
jgi:hypothetical protein